MTGAPRAEAVLNADGEAMVIAPGLEGDPMAFEAGPGGVVRLVLRDGGETYLALPPEASEAASRNGRILVVVPDADGRPRTERWLFAS